MTRVLMTVVVAVLSLAQPASTGSQTFGSWEVSTKDRDALHATTINDSGHLLGQYCYLDGGSCLWLLGFRSRCEADARYPVLMNSSAGSRSLEVLCGGEVPGLPGLFRYVFTNFDQINEAVLGSTRIGFAFPLQGDEFRVVRFDLAGASAALSAMRAAATKRIRPVHRGTQDEKL